MKIKSMSFVIIFFFGSISSATILPVGPITFGSNADYDNNFKESNSSLSGISRNALGYLSIVGAPTGLAIYDTSSSGGVNGSGGFAGNDANADLKNFIISADLGGSTPQFGGAFLLRLNNAEANGYYVGAHTISPTAVVFEVFESTSAMFVGSRIFGATVDLTGVTLAGNVFYPFKVTVVDGKFDFNFANSAGTASYTDPSISASIGQVGILMDTFSPSTETRLDNFQIQPIPEPSTLLLIGLCLIVCASGIRAVRT